MAVIHRSNEGSCAASTTTAATLSATLIATVLLVSAAMAELSLSVEAALLSLTRVLRPGILLIAGLTTTASATTAATAVTVAARIGGWAWLTRCG